MSTEQNVWPVRGYWIGFNPKTHSGIVGLQLDKDRDSDVKFENLTAEDITALVAILSRGGAEYYRSTGIIGISG